MNFGGKTVPIRKKLTKGSVVLRRKASVILGSEFLKIDLNFGERMRHVHVWSNVERVFHLHRQRSMYFEADVESIHWN